MAMLAGPRRKQKVINLRAKNNAWSEDTTKFGQRMLEKMGWSAGKGLGAKENGIVEHVVARYKNDDRGLGFEDRNDQWTKHEDDFNSLLANLSNGNNNEDNKLHSGVSLEVKSKTSKARVHYHKFTRGKDLTRYSEKDLANIFGKKSLKNENKPSTDVKEESSVKIDEKESTTVDKVFTEGGSMEDYFKSKLAAMKSKSKLNIQNVINSDENTDYSFQGFSGTREDEEETHQGFGFQSFSFTNAEEIEAQAEEIDNENNQNLVESKKKKKKKRKHRDEEPVTSEIVDNVENIPTQLDTCVDETQKSKKSKKKKKKDFEENVAEPVEPTETVDETIETKKSKKKKHIDVPAEHVAEDYVPKKKKKRKDKVNE
ncbi:hypothetical protein HF086_004186 [Spodoptera exigua]|uniref:G-patch domain-containing protein n=1 Tax=Spodoptera exigua TaxID=7107 RepID=A0A922MK95_SPOEX|nr:hypothetical protein HF086_004186 [Spodoptera exigua]